MYDLGCILSKLINGLGLVALKALIVYNPCLETKKMENISVSTVFGFFSSSFFVPD